MLEGQRASSSAGHHDTLSGMAMGYFRSRALCAAARLGVADALANGEQSLDQLAATCQADPASLHRLLRTLASMGVISETAPSRFVLTSFGEPLRKDAPNSEWASVVFWADLLADNWSYLTECVRTGDTAGTVMKNQGVASRWSKDPNAGGVFRAVMGTAPAEDYMPIAGAWDFSRHKVVADLGGGGGGLIAAILTLSADLQGMLVDRPESIERAKPRFAADGLGARCRLIEGDLCAAVPPGADVYVMKHVLHGYGDQAAAEVLRNCRSVIPDGGRLLVVEFILPDVVDHPDMALERRFMSDLNMLTVTGGKERSAVEWKALLGSAGFSCLAIIPVPGDLVSIIEAAPLP